MNKALRKYVFHEVEVGGIAFKATLDQGRAALHVEDASGRESQVYLIGSGLPSLFYAESWTMRGRKLGPGWALCHDTPSEPVMHLGDLSDGEVSYLISEFGLHADLSREAVMFRQSAAARSLKRIVADDPRSAALFRKNAGWLDTWLDNVPPEGRRPSRFASI